jgi:hypothetical protein
MKGRVNWWGVAFVVGLLVVAAMVSIPTAAQSGDQIKAFYDANRALIVAQQIIGAVLLVPFLRFVVALERRGRDPSTGRTRWLLIVSLLLAAFELATNLLPLAMAAISGLSPGTVHALTFAEDLADAGLFVTIALLSVVAVRYEPAWVRIFGLAVAVVTFVRAFLSPLGVTDLDEIAPISFLVLVLVLSVRPVVMATAGEKRFG